MTLGTLHFILGCHGKILYGIMNKCHVAIVTAKLGLMPKSNLVKDRTRGSEVPLKVFLRKHREFWKTGKTNFALTVALILGSLFLGYAVYEEINAGWKGYKSLRIVLTDTSVFIPVGGLIAGALTLIGDLMMLWSDRSEKRIQEAAAKAAAEAAVKARAEGIEEGKKELAQKVLAWNLRRMEAERRDEPFYEPPPTE